MPRLLCQQRSWSTQLCLLYNVTRVLALVCTSKTELSLVLTGICLMTGEFPAFSTTFFRVIPILSALTTLVSIGLYAFSPGTYLLHESALVFSSLSTVTPSFSFSHDESSNARIPFYLPPLVLVYGTIVVLLFTALQNCILLCCSFSRYAFVLWWWHTRLTHHSRRVSAQILAAVPPIQALRCLGISCGVVWWRLVKPVLALAAGCLALLVWIIQPFFLAIFMAVLLTVVLFKVLNDTGVLSYTSNTDLTGRHQRAQLEV